MAMFPKSVTSVNSVISFPIHTTTSFLLTKYSYLYICVLCGMKDSDYVYYKLCDIFQMIITHKHIYIVEEISLNAYIMSAMDQF